MGVGIPVAFVLSPSILNFPVDLVLGIALPYHMHAGLQDITDDYAPPQYKLYMKRALTFIVVLAALGLLKINLCGPGIIQSLKSLWRKPVKRNE